MSDKVKLAVIQVDSKKHKLNLYEEVLVSIKFDSIRLPLEFNLEKRTDLLEAYNLKFGVDPIKDSPGFMRRVANQIWAENCVGIIEQKMQSKDIPYVLQYLNTTREAIERTNPRAYKISKPVVKFLGNKK